MKKILNILKLVFQYFLSENRLNRFNEMPKTCPKASNPMTNSVTKPVHVSGLDMALVYTDSQGISYYQYVNPLEIPAKRVIAIEAATRMLEMNLKRERLLSILDAMEKNANTGNIVALFGLIQETKARLELNADEEALMNLSACYFVAEDEIANDYLPTQTRKKIERWKQDPEAYIFFLGACTRLASSLDEASLSDFLTYLQQINPIIQEMNRISTSNPSINK